MEIQRYELKEQTQLPTQPPSWPNSATDRNRTGEDKTPKAATKVQKDTKDTSYNETTREKWKSKVEYMLSCISLTIGFGNMWRFPFVVLENGGGAFLIPYLIVLLFIGRPMYYLELCLGQFTSCGPSQVWELLPAFKGNDLI